MAELGYRDRKRIHNLKYYTWVEQQGRTMAELNDLVYDEDKTWEGVHGQARRWMSGSTPLTRPPACSRAYKGDAIAEKTSPIAKCVPLRRAEYEAVPGLTTCTCGGMLDIQYDYGYIRTLVSPETLSGCRTTPCGATGPSCRWSPLPSHPSCGWLVPAVPRPASGPGPGLKALYIKDDGQNPTSSLKDRASRHGGGQGPGAGADTIACSSTGNAASSLAGNACGGGAPHLYLRARPGAQGQVAQLMIFGATVITVDGSYEDTFELSKAAIAKWGWYNRNAAINPYLLEGKKTVTLEILEQLGWHGPGLHRPVGGGRLHHRRGLEGAQGP
jgi:hypothetical protein